MGAFDQPFTIEFSTIRVTSSPRDTWLIRQRKQGKIGLSCARVNGEGDADLTETKGGKLPTGSRIHSSEGAMTA